MQKNAEWPELKEIAKQHDGEGQVAQIEAHRRVVEAIDKLNASSTVLATRNFWLTVAVALLTVVQVAIVVVQLWLRL